VPPLTELPICIPEISVVDVDNVVGAKANARHRLQTKRYGVACCRYENGTVTLKAGNALDDPALEEYGPFDAIHVGAAAPDLPQVLV
jgi:protein-L-isoaspartate O-methyltransferase